ncbi:type IIL restriction-modification enzyme MmeI [Moraxella sp. FZLJ2109]|uniref:type IIL restriction-modification enzyme MmeI n=1 Tax=unclassified Moraxella TaxID=2685852 RepID=UPI003531CA26
MRLEEQANIIAALTQAHKNLDLAVDKAYRKEKFKDEAERVAFLFERYGEMA